MGDRQVTATGKDTDGDITSLCGGWGAATKTEAIRHIESHTHRYYVVGTNSTKVDGPTGPYLRTDPDGQTADSLDRAAPLLMTAVIAPGP